jgi:hypothetical protein
MLGAIFAAQTVAPKAGTDAVTVPTTVRLGTYSNVRVPHLINFQGKLTDASGVPLPSGNYALTFSIWTAATGGTQMWTETQSAVPVTNGLFNAVLGTVVSDPVIPANGIAWLQTAVGATVISPRVEFTTAPYAYNANNADSLEGFGPSAFAAASHDHTVSTGDVTGTLSGGLTIGRGVVDSVRLGNGQVNLYKIDPTGAGDQTALMYTTSGGLSWGNPVASGLTTILPINRGGTGTGTAPTQYGIIYAATASGYASTGAGTAGQVLTSNGSSAPTYQALSVPPQNWAYSSPYLYPNYSGYVTNAGVRMYNTGNAYNVYGQTNSSGQSAVYGYDGNSGGYPVYGYNSQYAQMGILGPAYSLVGNYPVGIYGASSYQGIYGYSSSGYTYGVLGCYGSPVAGAGVYGYGYSSTSYYGVYGYGYNAICGYCSYSGCWGGIGLYTPTYTAVYGYGSSYYGIYGYSGSSSYYSAVYGYGYYYGIYGYSSAYGIWGILGSYNSGYPTGVYGYGGSYYGVYGYTGSSSYGAIYGYGYYYGVYGYCSAYGCIGHLASYGGGYPCGVYGYSASYRGVYGYSGSSTSYYAAVYGYGYYGVYGYSMGSGSIGVLGSYIPYFGVYGYEGSGSGFTYGGVYGYGAYLGVYGVCGSYSTYGALGAYGTGYPCGVYAYAASYYGVYAYQSSSYGSYFYNTSGYYAEVNYSSYKIYGSGSVSTYIIDDNDMERALHCPESPGVMFEDYGSEHLSNGRCVVQIDPLLLKGVTISDQYPLRVYVTPTDGAAIPLGVTKGTTSFEVVGPNGSNASFDWRIVCYRKDYEYQRFEARERPAALRGTRQLTPKEVDAQVKANLLANPLPPAGLEVKNTPAEAPKVPAAAPATPGAPNPNPPAPSTPAPNCPKVPDHPDHPAVNAAAPIPAPGNVNR